MVKLDDNWWYPQLLRNPPFGALEGQHYTRTLKDLAALKPQADAAEGTGLYEAQLQMRQLNVMLGGRWWWWLAWTAWVLKGGPALVAWKLLRWFTQVKEILIFQVN